MKIAVIGFGVLGHAHQILFPDAYIYDKYKKIGKQSEVNKCDATFICVPAEWNGQELDLGNIREILGWCKVPNICIKTTVMVGDTEKLAKEFDRPLVFSPEFLRDKYWKSDIMKAERVIIGTLDNPFTSLYEWDEGIDNVFSELFNEAYGGTIPIERVNVKVAEFTKLYINFFLASKVTLLPQLVRNYESKLGGLMSEQIIHLITQDNRIGVSHSEYKGKWGGKCFLKDYQAFIALGKRFNLDTSVPEAIWKYNEKEPKNVEL